MSVRDALAEALDERGYAILPALLTAAECRELRAVYSDDTRFRTTISMARHGFGSGEYRYFRYPLPKRVQSLRTHLYRSLAPLANRWAERLREQDRFPAGHRAMLADCRRAGQLRPTPLLLRYRAGDYNCLHQDVYGRLTFPFQVICLLTEPGEDFEGGELTLVEQRPRRQSRPRIVHLRRGDAAVIATRHLPRRGARSFYRCVLKHGVSEVTRGERYTLGIIFHDSA